MAGTQTLISRIIANLGRLRDMDGTTVTPQRTVRRTVSTLAHGRDLTQQISLQQEPQQAAQGTYSLNLNPMHI